MCYYPKSGRLVTTTALRWGMEMDGSIQDITAGPNRVDLAIVARPVPGDSTDPNLAVSLMDPSAGAMLVSNTNLAQALATS